MWPLSATISNASTSAPLMSRGFSFPLRLLYHLCSAAGSLTQCCQLEVFVAASGDVPAPPAT